ncbi:hypothetical protein EJB05_33895, partial [Eragrostis curvula]
MSSASTSRSSWASATWSDSRQWTCGWRWRRTSSTPSAIAIVRECIGAPLRGRACDQAVVDENVSKLRAVLEVYEAIADLSHFTLMHYFMSTEYGPALLGPLPRVKAWWEELAARPAARKVATFMPLDFGVDKKKE